MTDLKYPAIIQTRSGIMFDLLNPRPDMIDIEDIAWSLSMQCRFAGHTDRFYSIAEHAVRVSWRVRNSSKLPKTLTEARQWILWGLMHDAAEAYVGDMTSPLKQLFPLYKEIEGDILEVIARKFNLTPRDMPALVGQEDLYLLGLEARDMMDDPEWATVGPFGNTGDEITPWPSAAARSTFLNEFQMLTR